jgi:hypothetical protein
VSNRLGARLYRARTLRARIGHPDRGGRRSPIVARDVCTAIRADDSKVIGYSNTKSPTPRAATTAERNTDAQRHTNGAFVSADEFAFICHVAVPVMNVKGDAIRLPAAWMLCVSAHASTGRRRRPDGSSWSGQRCCPIVTRDICAAVPARHVKVRFNEDSVVPRTRVYVDRAPEPGNSNALPHAHRARVSADVLLRPCHERACDIDTADTSVSLGGLTVCVSAHARAEKS